MLNKITITILDSGTCKIDCDEISGPSHQIAEKALAWIASELGGKVDRKKRTDIHQHQHEHNIAHEHQ